MHAAAWGVPYSVAARQIGSPSRALPAFLASCGRTVYPVQDGSWVQARLNRTLEESIVDARRAAALPFGRATHLAERFPSAIGRHGAGLFYHGQGRMETIALAYLAVCLKTPSLVPNEADLQWIAELGEESAIDLACTGIDRAARHLLGGPLVRVTTILVSAVIQAATDRDGKLGQPAIELARALEGTRLPLTGARQILDALLVVANGGHAPGTRVQLRDQPGTIVGLHWAAAGSPCGYEVRLDNVHLGQTFAEPGALRVLSGQDALPSGD
jgi:hypothetical protein